MAGEATIKGPGADAPFPEGQDSRGKSRHGKRELPAPHFSQPPYVADTGKRWGMDYTPETKSGDFKFSQGVDSEAP